MPLTNFSNFLLNFSRCGHTHEVSSDRLSLLRHECRYAVPSSLQLRSEWRAPCCTTLPWDFPSPLPVLDQVFPGPLFVGLLSCFVEAHPSVVSCQSLRKLLCWDFAWLKNYSVYHHIQLAVWKLFSFWILKALLHYLLVSNSDREKSE